MVELTVELLYPWPMAGILDIQTLLSRKAEVEPNRHHDRQVKQDPNQPNLQVLSMIQPHTVLEFSMTTLNYSLLCNVQCQST